MTGRPSSRASASCRRIWRVRCAGSPKRALARSTAASWARRWSSEAQRKGGFLANRGPGRQQRRVAGDHSVDYSGNEVVTASPAATAWDALVRLGVMGQLDPGPSATTAWRTSTRRDRDARSSLRAVRVRRRPGGRADAPGPAALRDYWEQRGRRGRRSVGPSSSASASPARCLTERAGIPRTSSWPIGRGTWSADADPRQHLREQGHARGHGHLAQRLARVLALRARGQPASTSSPAARASRLAPRS